MKSAISLVICVAVYCGSAFATVTVDEEAFGKSLGGWRKKSETTAEYPLSGSIYRTYRPETSKTPEGGIYLSIRIDHVRGWLSSNDHAILEITIGPKGTIESAKSNIAIQGKSITSDVIVGISQAGQAVTNVDQAVQVGTDLVADLTAKLLRENIVEAGRVSFPAALRHNYNLLYQALRVNGVAPGGDPGAAPSTVEATAAVPSAPSASADVPVQTKEHPAQAAGEEPPSADKQETPSADKEEPPPAALPVPEHKPLEVAPHADPKSDPVQGGTPLTP